MDNMKLWCDKYWGHLHELYKVFVMKCNENKVDWYNNISFEEFVVFVYNNSSKFINKWDYGGYPRNPPYTN